MVNESFVSELRKLAAAFAPSTNDIRYVEKHLLSDQKDWDAFNKSLRRKGTQRAVMDSPLADQKLKAYVTNYGQLVRSRNVVANVRSKSDPAEGYTIKKLPSGRLGCTCKDWQFKQSFSGGDCKHIKYLGAFKPIGKIKTGSVSKSVFLSILRGKRLANNASQWAVMSESAREKRENMIKIKEKRVV